MEALDLARFFALVGMIIVNFKLEVLAYSGSKFLVDLTEHLDGKSAALFVVLAGMGISLMGRAGDHKQKQLILIKRGLFLFCFGFINCFIYNGDILHVYGVFLIIAALMLNKEGYIYIFLAIILTILYVPIFTVYDYDTAWNWQNFNYVDFFTLKGFLRNLFYNGFFPVIPWLGFLFVGMWLGGQDLSKKKLHYFLIISGVTLMAIAFTSSHFILSYMINLLPESVNLINSQVKTDTISLMHDLFGTDSIPPLPIYILIGTGFAFLSIGIAFCLEAFEKLRTILRPLEITGRQTLSLYVAHIIFVIVPLKYFEILDHDRIEISLMVSFTFVIIAIIYANLWAKKYKRGPVEMLMRRITG